MKRWKYFEILLIPIGVCEFISVCRAIFLMFTLNFLSSVNYSIISIRDFFFFISVLKFISPTYQVISMPPSAQRSGFFDPALQDVFLIM
jgi:hypothetical protein